MDVTLGFFSWSVFYRFVFGGRIKVGDTESTYKKNEAALPARQGEMLGSRFQVSMVGPTYGIQYVVENKSPIGETLCLFGCFA